MRSRHRFRCHNAFLFGFGRPSAVCRPCNLASQSKRKDSGPIHLANHNPRRPQAQRENWVHQNRNPKSEIRHKLEIRFQKPLKSPWGAFRKKHHLECAGGAQRRRRFGSPYAVGQYQSGVALRLPPHSTCQARKLFGGTDQMRPRKDGAPQIP